MYAGEHEKELLADAYKNLSAHMGAKITLEADVWIKDKQHINPAGIDIEVIQRRDIHQAVCHIMLKMLCAFFR